MMQAGIINIMGNFQETDPAQAVNTKLFMHSNIQQVIQGVPEKCPFVLGAVATINFELGLKVGVFWNPLGILRFKMNIIAML